MRTSSTFSVLFWVHAQRAKNGLTPIYARISLNKKKLNISLKRKVDVELWDSKKQRVCGDNPYSLELNEFLDQEYSRLFQYYQELRIEGKVRSLENIQKKYFGE
ncbi:MAG: Arm DNA-binding domain-containing protein, partial [Christiangramia sp.]|nr:Arm DNA-binding domain-containing protein [Christiangramia sp.]